MLKTELIESDGSYTISIENEDIFITITYVDGWYDYQWNMAHKKRENIKSDFSEENWENWKKWGILIPDSSEIYPCFLKLFDNLSKGKEEEFFKEHPLFFDEQIYKELYDAENETITWVTNEYCMDDNKNNFQIIKTEDGIKVIFNYIHKPAVRVTMSGCRYGDFNLLFARLFSDLRSTLKSKGKVKTKNKVK